jgi:uncharacterized glyoxalase superfamily protein PhnB
MKTYILALLSSLVITASALAHGGVELGPNGGRILEFSKNETMHGEVTFKDGKFRIAVLDKDMKPVKLAAQTLNASGGPTGKAVKLDVAKEGEQFVIPAVKSGEWLILQYKDDATAKAVTARLEYDTKNCEKCNAQEWICKCAAEKKK